MSGQPTLKVPAITFSDKTPTPTRLLKAVDAIGLFREDNEEKVCSSAISTSSNNPFDVDFRNALIKNDKPADSSPVQEVTNSGGTSDDVLNTPQIIHESAPTTAAIQTSKTNDFKKIAPVPSKVPLKLLKTIQSTTHKTAVKIKVRKPRRKTDKEELKERNRAAASRSRQKKKLLTDCLHKKIEVLTTQNKQLMSENTALKKELEALKNQMDLNKRQQPLLITLDQNFIQPPRQ